MMSDHHAEDRQTNTVLLYNNMTLKHAAAAGTITQRPTVSGHSPTCPVEVKARDDWLPAHTFLMNIPCRASTTFGL